MKWTARTSQKALRIMLASALVGTGGLTYIGGGKAHAESTDYAPYRVSDGHTHILIDGAELETEVEAQIIDGSTLVPVRAVSEAFDADVEWLGEENRVTIKQTKYGDNEIVLYINQTDAYINGEERTLEVPAQLIDGNTMVPLRFIGEAFGLEVGWEADTKTVTLDTNRLPEPSLDDPRPVSERQTEEATNDTLAQVAASLDAFQQGKMMKDFRTESTTSEGTPDSWESVITDSFLNTVDGQEISARDYSVITSDTVNTYYVYQAEDGTVYVNQKNDGSTPWSKLAESGLEQQFEQAGALSGTEFRNLAKEIKAFLPLFQTQDAIMSGPYEGNPVISLSLSLDSGVTLTDEQLSALGLPSGQELPYVSLQLDYDTSGNFYGLEVRTAIYSEEGSKETSVRYDYRDRGTQLPRGGQNLETLFNDDMLF